MTNAEQSQHGEPGLLGVEIGRNKIRLVLLDNEGRRLLDVVERPIAKAGGPRDPIAQELSTRAALEAALSRLDLARDRQILAGATIGFADCGVGSGPALLGWLETLSDDLDEPIVFTGDQGVSYAPARCVEFVQRVFDQTGLHLDRVELAPVAASRVVGPLPTGALTLGSGVAWSARVLDDEVLEAYEISDGPFDDVLQLVASGDGRPLASLEGLEVDEKLCRNRGVSIAALAPAAGVALALVNPERTNLLDGETVFGSPAVNEYGSDLGDPRDRAWSDIGIDPGSAPVADLAPLDLDKWSSARIDDTYQLNRIPGSGERFDHGSDSYSVHLRGPGREPIDDLAGIEAFAHPEDRPPRGFHVSNFILAVLGIFAVALTVALVLA